MTASLKQARQILALVDETGWTREEIQRRIIEHFGWLREVGVLLGDGELTPDQFRALLSTRERVVAPKPVEDFASEEVASTFGYPSDWKLRPVGEQAECLVQAFGSLDISHVADLAERWTTIPEGMDGLAVIPKLSAMVRFVKKPPKKWAPVNVAMQMLIASMKQVRTDFKYYLGGNIGPEYLKLEARTAEALAKLESLPGDVLVIPVQTGIRYGGKSVRRAHFLIRQNQSEFGLDSFAAGCIVLTHPERLQSDAVLFMDCPGSEYAPYADGQFTAAPVWYFWGGGLGLGCYWVHAPDGQCGSASGALSE